MTNPEDGESEEDAAGMAALRRELEPLYEKARLSKYALLNFGGGGYALVIRTHCSVTGKDRRRTEPDELFEQLVAMAEFELMSGYERGDYSTAINQLIKLRNEEDAHPES